MEIKSASEILEEILQTAQLAVNDTNTYIQVSVILVLYALAFIISYKIKRVSGLEEISHQRLPIRCANSLIKLAEYYFHSWLSFYLKYQQK